MSKPKQTLSDQCRVCRCNFKVKFGTASQPSKTDSISSENLLKASKRKDTYGQILADICRAVGIEVVENSLVSDRVCNPCARKIRNLGTLYKLIQSSMGTECKPQDHRRGCSIRGQAVVLVVRMFVSIPPPCKNLLKSLCIFQLQPMRHSK